MPDLSLGKLFKDSEGVWFWAQSATEGNPGGLKCRRLRTGLLTVLPGMKQEWHVIVIELVSWPFSLKVLQPHNL